MKGGLTWSEVEDLTWSDRSWLMKRLVKQYEKERAAIKPKR